MARKRTTSLTRRPDAPDEVSRTKIGGILVGVSTILGAAGSYLLGDIDLITCLQNAAVGLGAILIAIGVRDIL